MIIFNDDEAVWVISKHYHYFLARFLKFERYLARSRVYTGTFKSLNAGGCVITGAEGFQSCCLCTLHSIENPPKHRAGQSPIWHLGHKQPNAQPVRGTQIMSVQSKSFLVKIEA